MGEVNRWQPHNWYPDSFALRAAEADLELRTEFALLEVGGGIRRSVMADIAKLRNIAHKLRAWAQEIRRDAEIVAHATSNEDSGLLDSAAKEMEEAADEIERLQSLNGR